MLVLFALTSVLEALLQITFYSLCSHELGKLNLIKENVKIIRKSKLVPQKHCCFSLNMIKLDVLLEINGIKINENCDLGTATS